MWYVATVNAYDALDRVVVAAVLRSTAGGVGDPVEDVLQCVTTVEGVGEDDPRQWLRDALVGLLEAL